MWANVCVASAVFKDKNLQYVFRPQVHSDQFGEASCTFLAENAKDKLGKEVKDIKVAIIHEDGPYGVGVAMGNEAKCKELGMQIVHKEGYAATSTDLSALVTKLRRAQPDVILHTGYNPDITLFLRQSKEAGLKWSALIGHGAGYGQIDKLIETFKDDVNYIYNVDPVAAQLLDPKTLKPGLGDLTAEMVKRYKAETRRQRSAAARLDGLQPGLDLPHRRAAARHQEARRLRSRGAAQGRARDRHSRVGGTIQGYGVKFFPPGHKMAGQNERSSPVVMQYIKGETKIAWPKAIKTADPVLPLPGGPRLRALTQPTCGRLQVPADPVPRLRARAVPWPSSPSPA